MNNTAELIREALEQAHMAGQAAAGVDPSYSGAQVYAREALANTAAAASLEAQEPVAWMRGFVTYAGVDGRTGGERICSERKVYDDDLPLYLHPPTSAVPEGCVPLPREAYNFLMGICALDGVWFGEPHPERKGAFWWRAYIRDLVIAAAPPAPQSSDAEDAE